VPNCLPDQIANQGNKCPTGVDVAIDAPRSRAGTVQAREEAEGTSVVVDI